MIAGEEFEHFRIPGSGEALRARGRRNGVAILEETGDGGGANARSWSAWRTAAAEHSGNTAGKDVKQTSEFEGGSTEQHAVVGRREVSPGRHRVRHTNGARFVSVSPNPAIWSRRPVVEGIVRPKGPARR